MKLKITTIREASRARIASFTSFSTHDNIIAPRTTKTVEITRYMTLWFRSMCVGSVKPLTCHWDSGKYTIVLSGNGYGHSRRVISSTS